MAKKITIDLEAKTDRAINNIDRLGQEIQSLTIVTGKRIF